MAHRSVIKYRIQCTTTNTKQCEWLDINDPPLNYCPRNSEHTVDLGSLAIVDTVTTTEIKIQEEEKIHTQGIYKFQGFDRVIPSGNIGDVTAVSVSWPRDVSIINGWFYSTQDNIGDRVDANVNATAGYVTANISANTSTFFVNNTVLDNIYKGYNVKITDFISKSDILGEVLSINTANSTITTTNNTINSYNTLAVYGGFTTYIQMTSRVIQDLKVNCPCVRYAFAEKKLGGRHLPANTPIVLNYTNNSGNTKNFTFNIEHLY
jgi:hypothetical protein